MYIYMYIYIYIYLENIIHDTKITWNIILWTVVAVGLYPNTPHEESLYVLRNELDNRMEKYKTKVIYR